MINFILFSFKNNIAVFNLILEHATLCMFGVLSALNVICLQKYTYFYNKVEIGCNSCTFIYLFLCTLLGSLICFSNTCWGKEIKHLLLHQENTMAYFSRGKIK